MDFVDTDGGSARWTKDGTTLRKTLGSHYIILAGEEKEKMRKRGGKGKGITGRGKKGGKWERKGKKKKKGVYRRADRRILT